MTTEELELAIKLAQLLQPERTGVDIAVDIIEAPFKIANRLLDDIFG